MGDGPPTVELLSDNRLSEGARLIGFWILSQERDEDGWLEIPFDSVRPFLYGFPSDDVIRRHLRMLTGSGWAERKIGGRGHSDSYRIIDPRRSGSKDRPAQERGYNPDRLGSGAGLKPRSSSKEIAVAVEPPMSPLPLSEAATKALDQHDDLLSGCRGALTDYLMANVPPKKQQPYVQSLATYLNGFGVQWQNGDGKAVPPEARTGLIAAALNELGAQDEKGMKNPVGDIRNLRTKLGILARDYGRKDGGRNGGDHGGTAPGKGRSQAAGSGGRRGGFVYEE